jgi:16S rRNA (uracil1498-N3)-methyltransferase
VAKRIDRWRKIALEASKQSGRARLMKISEPVDFNDLLLSHEDRRGPVWLFSERGGKPFPFDINTESLTAVVGPEGGWDSLELDLAIQKEVEIVTLGGRILRAETAAIAIAAILEHRFGDVH